MRRLGEEHGLTLIELMVAAVVLLLAMGATLAALEQFQTVSRVTDVQNDAQEVARRGLTRLARELRGLASPTNELPQAVEKAEAKDLIFQSVAQVKPAGSQNDRNTIRIRYCVETATSTLWRQEQTWTTAAAPSVPASDVCPAPGSSGNWSTARASAEHVVNDSRAVFTYNAGQLSSITEVRAKLYVDVEPGKEPKEANLETGVFFRNQNRSPTASFTAAPSGSQITLNASDSTDPEGKALSYLWYDNGTYIGDGIQLTYNTQNGSHPISLKVRDPAGLENTAPTQTVCVGGSC